MFLYFERDLFPLSWNLVLFYMNVYIFCDKPFRNMSYFEDLNKIKLKFVGVAIVGLCNRKENEQY